MSQPEDLPEAKSKLTSVEQDLLGQMTDQFTDEVERSNTANAEAARPARVSIRKAIGKIRPWRDLRADASMPSLPPAVTLRLPEDDAAKEPPTTAIPPWRDRDFTGVEARSRCGLDPELVPPPPRDRRRQIPILARFALMIAFAAIVAYGITMLSSLQSQSHWPERTAGSTGAVKDLSDRAPIEAPQMTRLLVGDRQAFANEPILLRVAVAPATGYGSLSLAGLAHGTRLSAGAALSGDRWELPVRDIDNVYVFAPMDFVGVMNAVIALLSPSRRVIDSQPMRLAWLAKADSFKPPVKQLIDTTPVNADAAAKGQSVSRTSNVVGKQGIDSATVGGPEVKPMDSQDAAVLMARGWEFLKNGDVSSAQLAFRRLADAGRADAALALATTYDPRYLAEHKLLIVVGDEAKALAWYQRARELGSTEAEHILQRADRK
jgi:hypothetical protein